MELFVMNEHISEENVLQHEHLNLLERYKQPEQQQLYDDS